jgi:uncharacterized protein (DUF58 family)
VKRFQEERELTVMFLVDLSASGDFGSVEKVKNDVAAELCALLAFAAIKNNDKVGLVVFTDCIELFIPPAKGTLHVLRIIRELLNFRPRQAQTNIAEALDYLGRVITKRCVVFLVSDFFSEDFEAPMRVLGHRHDLIAVAVGDRREAELPDVGLIELEDAETGEIILLDTGSAAVRRNYERFGRERAEGLRRIFLSMGVDHVSVATDQDYVKQLVHFFRTRERRLQNR